MQPEAKIGKKIKEYVDSLPKSFLVKIHGGPQMMAGLPDWIGCIEGLFVGIEVKQPGQNPTARQVFVHSLIRRAGGCVIVAHSVEEAQEGIEALFASHDLVNDA